MMKPVIAVSGRKGQVGWELERISADYPHYQFIFCDRTELDITDEAQAERFFQTHKPSFFINTAAYTAVDKAETDQASAYLTNASAVGALAGLCKRYNTTFITFSTDYVFNGSGSSPYTEDHPTEPVNYYGYSKEAGEKLALSNNERTIIIRTSWVYSSHGANFVKTILRLMKERSDINVVNDQFGSPTYAKDLATATMRIIGRLNSGSISSEAYGIFHFSNEGEITWFDFASAIKDISSSPCNVHPVPSSAFPTPAKRPGYSVLNKGKITAVFNIELKNWKESLESCIKEMLQ